MMKRPLWQLGLLGIVGRGTISQFAMRQFPVHWDLTAMQIYIYVTVMVVVWMALEAMWRTSERWLEGA